MAFHSMFHPFRVACGILVLAAASPVAAQQRDTTRAAADSARARAFLLPPLVASVARTPVQPERVGFALSVVTAHDLAARTPVYAADALRDVTGAFIEEAAGPGGPTIVRLRGGEEVFTQILMDGVQVNENGGFFDFQGLALSNLERVEVARGPQSALFGSSAVSGVVQFLTARGEVGPARVTVTGEGSAASADGHGWRASAKASGGGERVQWSAGAGSAFARGIYALPHDTRTIDGSLRMDAALSSRIELTGTARIIAVESKLPVRDPGTTRVPLDPNARTERDRLVSALTARMVSPGGTWSHHLRVSLYGEDFVYDDLQDPLPVMEEPEFFVFNANFRQDTRRSRTTLDYGGSVQLAAGTATVSFGAQAEREAVHTETDFEGTPGEQRLDRTSRAAFAEVLFTPVRGVDVLAGARIESFEGLDPAFTPRASVVVDLITGRLSARAAAGRAFKAPNLQEQYLDNPFIASNPDLAPETSVSWEVGLDAKDAAGRIAAEVTVFRQTFDDLIRTVQFDETRQINRNLGRSRAQGIEWTARFVAHERATIGTHGALVSTDVLDNTGLDAVTFPLNETLPGRPSVVASAWIEGDAGHGITGVIRTTTVGSQTVLSERFSGRRIEIDAYTVLGATLHFSVTDALGIYTRIENLLGTDYQTAFDRAGIPRTAALGFRLQH